jgi:chromosome segregation ATPase
MEQWQATVQIGASIVTMIGVMVALWLSLRKAGPELSLLQADAAKSATMAMQLALGEARLQSQDAATKAQQLAEQLAKVGEESVAKDREHNAALEKNREQITALADEKAELADQVAKLGEELKTEREGNAGLTERVAALEQEVRDERVEKAAFLERIQTLERDLEAMTRKYTAVLKENEKLRGRIQKLEEQPPAKGDAQEEGSPA